MRISHIVIRGSSVSYNIFPHFLINGTIFGKKKLPNAKCVFLNFPTNFVWNISRSKKKWARYDQKMYFGFHVKYPLFLSDFNEIWIFARFSEKNPQISISWKSVQWEPNPNDTGTDMTKLNSRFSQYCEPEWKKDVPVAVSSVIRFMKGFKVKWSRYRPGVAQRVGRSIALLFLDRGTRRGWVVSSTARLHFTPGKDPVPIVQEAGWAPGPVWTGEISRPHRDSIPDRPARSQSLYRLSYPAHPGGFYNNQIFVLT